jgi:hypothetical protein
MTVWDLLTAFCALTPPAMAYVAAGDAGASGPAKLRAFAAVLLISLAVTALTRYFGDRLAARASGMPEGHGEWAFRLIYIGCAAWIVFLTFATGRAVAALAQAGFLH